MSLLRAAALLRRVATTAPGATIRKVGIRTAAAGGLAAAAAYGMTVAEAEPAPSRLVMSGDCGGTNTRLLLFRVAPGAKATQGEQPAGKVLYEKKYLNAEYESFTSVCELFLKESSRYSSGEKPEVCCLACAGGITNNTVSFTNVKEGWVIDCAVLEKTLGTRLLPARPRPASDCSLSRASRHRPPRPGGRHSQGQAHQRF